MRVVAVFTSAALLFLSLHVTVGHALVEYCHAVAGGASHGHECEHHNLDHSDHCDLHHHHHGEDGHEGHCHISHGIYARTATFTFHPVAPPVDWLRSAVLSETNPAADQVLHLEQGNHSTTSIDLFLSGCSLLI